MPDFPPPSRSSGHFDGSSGFSQLAGEPREAWQILPFAAPAATPIHHPLELLAVTPAPRGAGRRAGDRGTAPAPPASSPTARRTMRPL